MLSAAVILALQTGLLARAAVSLDTIEAVVFALHAAVALHVLLMAGISLPQDMVIPHTYSVIHLSVVTFCAAFTLGTTALLPGSYHVTGSLEATSLALWYIVLGLYWAAFIIMSTTPLGPLVHYSAANIYDEKTVSQITNTARDNVCGIVGASIWDTLMFSYTTKVVMLGNTSESLEIGDLPIVPGDMRASTIYASMKIAMRNARLRVRNWTPKSGSGWDLGWRLVKLNKKVMVTQLSLAVASACIFYVPALFLKLLLSTLR